MIINKNNKLAVSMEWSGDGAPKVTAKGKGLVAEQIIALAEQHKLPIKSDSALVNLLSAVELGEDVPEQLYVAVAEVIAFAYRLKGELATNQSPQYSANTER